MFIHPLLRDDLRLIQDFMLTKITLLLAQNASGDEWAFEIRTMQELSGVPWDAHNGLLFDYTLARFIAAGSSQGEPVDESAQPANSPLGSLVTNFIDSVNDEDNVQAHRVWDLVTPEDRATATFALVARLQNKLKDGNSHGDLAARFPAPITSL